jgi:hypothetical protein
MARARSQALVIDASVACAAGPEDASYPTAKHCRDFLLAVRDICHRATFTSELSDEWKEHQSGFARQWRYSMFARKKIGRLDTYVNESFRQDVDSLAVGDNQRRAMLKDAHLIEAALVQGMRIVAMDEIARGYFRAYAGCVKQVRKICWVNPDVPEEEALAWLQNGAPLEGLRMLGHEKADE